MPQASAMNPPVENDVDAAKIIREIDDYLREIDRTLERMRSQRSDIDALRFRTRSKLDSLKKQMAGSRENA